MIYPTTLVVLNSPVKCGCGTDDISLELVRRLQVVREMIGKPIHVNSGIRCAEHNKAVGGVEDSEHLAGEGVDIACEDSHDRYELMLRLVNRFNRIGVGKDFIHVGMKGDKPQEVIWLYD